MLVVPVVVAGVFGLADQRANASLPVGLVQSEHGRPGDELARSVRDSKALRVTSYSSIDAMELAVRRGDVLIGVEIPAGYGADTPLRVFGKASDSAFVAARADVMLIAARQAALSEQAGTPASAPVEVERETARSNTNATGLGRATAGMLVFFMFHSSLYMGAIFIDERSRGCVARMSTTPNARTVIVAGEIVGRAFVCFTQAVVIVLAGRLLFGVDWGDPLGIIMVIAMFALVGTSASLVLGSLGRGSLEQVSMGLLGVVGVLGLLGGCFWSLAIVPAWLRTAAHLSPHAWANDAFDKLLATDAGVQELWTPLVVLAGFAVALFVLAVASFRGALRR